MHNQNDLSRKLNRYSVIARGQIAQDGPLSNDASHAADVGASLVMTGVRTPSLLPAIPA